MSHDQQQLFTVPLGSDPPVELRTRPSARPDGTRLAPTPQACTRRAGTDPMSHDQQLFALPSDVPDPVDLRWLVDVVVLSDVEAFLVELSRLTGHMELVVDRLAEIIVAAGGPRGHDPAMRAFVVRLLAVEARRTKRLPGAIDLHEVVSGALFDRQAELEACLDPAVGHGGLSRRAAGLLLAMIVPAACRARSDGRPPVAWRGLAMWDHDLCRLGEPLLGVRLAGHEPFRLVRAGELGRGQLAADHLPGNQRIIWHLLELARVTSRSGDHGLVVVPHLDTLDEVPELPEAA